MGPVAAHRAPPSSANTSGFAHVDLQFVLRMPVAEGGRQDRTRTPRGTSSVPRQETLSAREKQIRAHGARNRRSGPGKLACVSFSSSSGGAGPGRGAGPATPWGGVIELIPAKSPKLNAICEWFLCGLRASAAIMFWSLGRTTCRGCWSIGWGTSIEADRTRGSVSGARAGGNGLGVADECGRLDTLPAAGDLLEIRLVHEHERSVRAHGNRRHAARRNRPPRTSPVTAWATAFVEQLPM